MSVVGIDFGNLNTVVAVARNRGIDVIVNETSNRATPSLVSLSDKQRYLGEGAKNQETSNFKNTVSSLKRLIGRPFNDPEVATFEKPFVNARLVPTQDGKVAAAVNYLNEQKEFNFTQLAAMFLVKVREFTTAEIKVPVSDCVISCPTWFTDVQRRALLDAAEIAGLNCLRLMNDTTASALAYGITKTDLPDPADATQKPRNVAFVDMGHSSYQVAIVSFVKGKLIVKGTACDRNLGGRNYDQVLTDHYVQEFGKKYKIDIASNAKAIFRLRQGCEKVKKILSANPQAMLNVECLMDDKDVSAQVSRDEFMEWARSLSDRLIQPIQEALDAAGLKPEDVDFVELIGGSTRLPIVKETLATFFGGSLDGPNKLSTTLNQDEAVARGCALQCAILSPVFKVRDFSVQDWNNHGIELHWDGNQMPEAKAGEQKITQMEAFPVGNAIPSSKILTFLRALDADELQKNNGELDLTIHARYLPGSGCNVVPKDVQQHVGQWLIKGIKHLSSCDTKDEEGNVISSKATIKVKAKLDGDGLLTIDSASQIEELVVPDESAEKKEGEEPKTKKVVKRHELQVLPSVHSAPRATVQEWLAEEGAMYAADRQVIDTAEKRNALEEYVYETRSKLEMAWSEFCTDDVRNSFMSALTQMEDWLYGEGEDALKSVYVEKLAELKKIGDPIAFRYTQREERPIVEKQFREYVNSVLIEVSSNTEKYAHIEPEQMQKVNAECQKKIDWLNDQIAKQNETAKHVDPVVTTDQILKEKESLYFLVTPILNKPKPVPKKEEKKEDKKDEKQDKKEEKQDAAEPAEPAAQMDID